MKKYSVTTPEELRRLCITQNWFTCGTNEQYEDLFKENESGVPIEEIAFTIWLCSEPEFTEEGICAELEAAHKKYKRTFREEC